MAEDNGNGQSHPEPGGNGDHEAGMRALRQRVERHRSNGRRQYEPPTVGAVVERLPDYRPPADVPPPEVPDRRAEALELHEAWNRDLPRPANSYDREAERQFVELLRLGHTKADLLERIERFDRLKPFWDFTRSLPNRSPEDKARERRRLRDTMEARIRRLSQPVEEDDGRPEQPGTRERRQRALARARQDLALLQASDEADARAESAPASTPPVFQALDQAAWEPPVPLGHATPVDPFPLDLLPGFARRLVEDAAAALACPADYVAVPELVTFGLGIGNTRALRIKEGWYERPSIFAGVVAYPGSGKSPSLEAVTDPLFDQQELLALRHQELVARGQVDAIRETLVVQDFTTERLTAILRDNPRGVAVVEDELSFLIGSLNRYRQGGKGNDKDYLCRAWNGSAVSYERQGKHIFVRRPFLSIVGGIQPDKLGYLRGDRDVLDGWMDRFLFTYPARTPAVGERWKTIERDVAEAWEQKLRCLREDLSTEPGIGGTRVARKLALDDSGIAAWQRFTDRIADEQNTEGFPDFLRGPYEKDKRYCGRLTVILRYFDYCAGECHRDDDIDGRTIDRAAALIRYFQSHRRKVYGCMSVDPRVEEGRHLLRWIYARADETFTKRELQRSLCGRVYARFRSALDLEAPLAMLVNHGYVRQEKPSGRPQGGGVPSLLYRRNPLYTPKPSDDGATADGAES